MPRFDPLMEEGIIIEWKKKEGELVEKGEVLVVIEGEKTTFEFQSPYKGVLRKVLKREKEVAKVGEPIAIIDET